MRVAGWAAYWDEYAHTHQELHASFDAFCREKGAPPLPPLEFAHTSTFLNLTHDENYMEGDVLRRILSRELHWNNAELACSIMFDRRPNVYAPDVHMLMSFLHT